jgi:hypothetical protein
MVEASFHQGVNLVSLLLGELPIVYQECFLDLVVKVALMLLQLALYLPSSKLHLQVEFTRGQIGQSTKLALAVSLKALAP